MRLLLDGIRAVYDFDKVAVYTVIIENKKFYMSIVDNFISTLNGDSEKAVLYTDDKVLVLSKNVVVVDNVFNLDFGSTKLMNALYENLRIKVQNTELQGEYFELVKVLTSFYDHLEEESDFSVEWKNDVSLLALLKAAGYSLDVYGNRGSLEQVLDYLHIHRDALGIKLFVFLNSKVLFETDELKKFYEQCDKEDIKILNLDVTSTPQVFDGEKIVRVDKDLCEIF